jgi:hypothetical protein
MSFRSLIEICLPYSVAPQVSDWLYWLGPIVFWGILIWVLKDYIKTNLIWCIGGCVVIYFSYMWMYANTQYKWDWDDPRADGCGHTFVWLNEPALAKAEAGEITWEEYHWRKHLLLRVGQDLVLEGAMPVSAYKEAAYPLRDYFLDRDNRLRDLKVGLVGGTISHLAYRRAIDKMNEETYEPWNSYIEMRDHEQDALRHQVLYPAGGGLVAFLTLGFAGKYLRKAYLVAKLKTGQRRFSDLLTRFNCARGIDNLSSINGALRLNYPRLMVGEVPLDLDGADFDYERHDVLHLKSGERLLLYSAHIPPTPSTPGPKPKPKFYFDGGTTPAPVNGSRRKRRASIFDQ